MKRLVLICSLIICFFIFSIQTTPAGSLAIRAEVEELNEFNHSPKTKTTKTTKKLTTKRYTSTTKLPKNTIPRGDVNPKWSIAVYGSSKKNSPQMIALGSILIVLGLFLCFMGFRLSQIMLAVMGLLTLGSVTWIALANCKPVAGYSRDSITMIVVPAGVGVVGAGIFFQFWTFSMYLAGAFGGFILALFVCSWKSDLVIIHLIGRSCFLGGLGLLFAILVYFAHRPIMFFVTSFVGAYSVMFGIDCLARVGMIAGPEAMLNYNVRSRVEYVVTKYVYVLLGMVLALFIISMVWQIIFNAAYEFGLQVASAVKGEKAHEEQAKPEEAAKNSVEGSGNHD